MIQFSGNSELQVPQDGDKKSCFNIQTFPCVHEYFPVYTSVHFPDHEMEQLCMCTVTRKFYLKSVLFSSQYVYPISNINIYFLRHTQIPEGGYFGNSHFSPSSGKCPGNRHHF